MEAISKLLIANRGEIAVRILRAAQDAGINTVAIYADQDRNARFVRLAHEAYALNGNTSAETYLVPEKILSIAHRSGANAIHPGYGFLSENADFAQMVIDHFDTLWREGAEQGRVVCIALHPYIMGQPHRIRALERALRYVSGHTGVWLATGAEIADWYLSDAWRQAA